jgi:enterochelin esterase family protein
MTRNALAAVLICATVGALRAQTPLSEVIVAGDLAPGVSRSFTIQAEAEDYLNILVEAQGIGIDADVLFPNGSRLKRVSGPTTGMLPITFAAETAGAYTVRLTGRTSGEPTQSGRYSIRLTQRLSLQQRVSSRQPPRSSAIIEALKRELAQTNSTDTSAFWTRVTASGVPVVEPLPDTKDFVLVTFLWRGNALTRNAVVVGRIGVQPSFRDNIMTRVADTDVWFLTKKMPAGARFAYGFMVNGPLVFEGPLFFQLQAASRQADPLNPRMADCADGATRYECLSLAELPGAAPQPWIVPSDRLPRGRIASVTFKSERLKNQRTLSIYTPPGYASDGAGNDLVVLFDEPMYLRDIPTATILDNLIAAGRIPPAVAVLVGNVNREAELSPNPAFAEFIGNELVPWVRSNYSVTRDPARVVIGGSSHGGLAAAYVAMRHPDTFGNVLSLSGSFHWAPGFVPGDPANAPLERSWLTTEFVRRSRMNIRFWLAAGAFESDTTGSGGIGLETSRHLRDVLLAKGYDVGYAQFPGGHDPLSWRGMLPDGLIALLGR